MDLQIDPKFWKLALKEFNGQLATAIKRLDTPDAPPLPEFQKFNRPEKLAEHQVSALDDCMDDVESYDRFLMLPVKRASSSKTFRGRKKTMMPINLQTAPSIRKILTAYLLATKERHPPLGSVPVLCLLLHVCGGDVQMCFRLFCHLQSMTHSYFRDTKENLCRSESLVLADLLLNERSHMCKHLRRIDCDVMDLSDLAFAWCSNLFTLSEFPVEFTLRCLGQTFAQGPSVLIGITFGVLLHFEKHILKLKTPAGFFDFFASRKFSLQLTLSSSENILSEALHIVSQKSVPRKKGPNSKYGIGTLKRHKSWNATIGRKCTLKFEKGFADSPSFDPMRDGLSTTADDFFTRTYMDESQSVSSVLLPEGVGSDHSAAGSIRQSREEYERMRKQIKDSNELIRDLEQELIQLRLDAQEAELIGEEDDAVSSIRRKPSASPVASPGAGGSRLLTRDRVASLADSRYTGSSRNHLRRQHSGSITIGRDSDDAGSPSRLRPGHMVKRSPGRGSPLSSPRNDSNAADSPQKDRRLSTPRMKVKKFGTMPSKPSLSGGQKASLHKKLQERNQRHHGGGSQSTTSDDNSTPRSPVSPGGRIKAVGRSSSTDATDPAANISMSSIFETNPTPSELQYLKNRAGSKIFDSRQEEMPTRYSNWRTSYSEALTKVEHPCILMQGWLYKTGRPSGIFNKQALHRRWFLLKGPYLTYLKSNLHSKPTKDKCLHISGCETRSLTGHTKGEYAIEILSFPAGSQPPSKNNISTPSVQPTSHAARIRKGSLAHPNQHRGPLSRVSNPDASSPEASVSYSGSVSHNNLHSALANVEKPTLAAPSKHDAQPGSKTSTLRKKFMRRASRSGAAGEAPPSPPAPDRFVLFASTEIEQVKWVASLQSASRGPLFAPEG